MKEAKWYEKTVFYEIHVPSFCDSNRDGIGDLKGVASRIPYLKELGIGGIWLTPFYPSPGADNGYDISDYRNVDPKYGALGDFESLLDTAHRAGIKVIIDMVLNHTSIQHPWFQESRKSSRNSYRDYYFWEKEPVNNWESFFDGSAWERDEVTEMYYYHAFAKEQACLNWTNGKVCREALKVLEFWLNLGVDGFRLDVINFLKTDREAFQLDNPVEGDKMIHLYDKNQKGIYHALQIISSKVHSYPNKYLLGEVGEEDLQIINSYVGEGVLDSAFQFNLGSMPKWDLLYLVEQMQKMEEGNGYPTLFFTSHDMSRHFERLCEKDETRAKLLAVFLLTARGIPFLYQGEEIPMENVPVESLSDIRDVQGKYAYEKKRKEGADEEAALLYAKQRTRDYSRGKIDWKRAEKRTGSLFETYHSLLKIRTGHRSLFQGECGQIRLQGNCLYYQRIYKEERIGIYLDFGGGESKLPDTNVIFEMLDESGRRRGLLRYE